MNYFPVPRKHHQNITNNHRNIQRYITELFKIVHNLITSLLENFLVIGSNYWNLRGFQQFSIERKRTIHCGLKTMKYPSPLLWSLLPEAGKMSATLHEFRSKVKDLTCYNILTGFVKLTFQEVVLYRKINCQPTWCLPLIQSCFTT